MTENQDDIVYRGGHTVDVTNCPRCKVSVRPVCEKCGHSLSGDFIATYSKDGKKLWVYTVCEVCKNTQVVKNA
jgi:hypothetical protein